MDSILTSVKKLLGIAEEYTAFDPDIIMSVNSVFTILQQLGVGPDGGFSISDATTTWSDYFGDSEEVVKAEAVKNYVGLKVKLMFDPPTSSSVMQATSNMVSELEWRLNVACDKTHGYGNSGTSTSSDCEKAIDDLLRVILNGEY
jgi:hypothetical protein